MKPLLQQLLFFYFCRNTIFQPLDRYFFLDWKKKKKKNSYTVWFCCVCLAAGWPLRLFGRAK
jgi:hypothetical protein